MSLFQNLILQTFYLCFVVLNALDFAFAQDLMLQSIFNFYILVLYSIVFGLKIYHLTADSNFCFYFSLASKTLCHMLHGKGSGEVHVPISYHSSRIWGGNTLTVLHAVGMDKMYPQ